MYGLEQQVLHTDVTGMPLEWINYQQAVRLYHAAHNTDRHGARGVVIRHRAQY
jgi:hypothetical protein